MKQVKTIGVLLIILAAVVISAMLLHIDIYWRFVDFTVVIVCLISGIILLRQK
jgi:hypothetical protein